MPSRALARRLGRERLRSFGRLDSQANDQHLLRRLPVRFTLSFRDVEDLLAGIAGVRRTTNLSLKSTNERFRNTSGRRNQS